MQILDQTKNLTTTISEPRRINTTLSQSECLILIHEAEREGHITRVESLVLWAGGYKEGILEDFYFSFRHDDEVIKELGPLA